MLNEDKFVKDCNAGDKKALQQLYEKYASRNLNFIAGQITSFLGRGALTVVRASL